MTAKTHTDCRQVLTVSELSTAIKQHLETRFFHLVVQGEVSNVKEQASGHLYFTLKDAVAQISAVLFKGNARTVSKMPKNGDQVIVKAEINVYPPKGYYQLIVRELTYVGVGALLLKLHEMKLKLQERGWFDKIYKKPLPKYPKSIGVVTSPTGSVIQDIVHILTRRLRGFHLILNPVKVQGEGAAEDIAGAIEQFNTIQPSVDVLILARGGGSLEDLWAFNEEKVAAAIFHSKIPIICAVGHETDYCIADFVADVRAPTPSAAAEIVTIEKAQQLHFLNQTRARLKQSIQTLIYPMRKQLEGFKRHPYLSSPYTILAPHLQRLDDFTCDLNQAEQKYVEHKFFTLSSIESQIKRQSPKNQIITAKTKLLAFDRSLLSALRRHLFSQKLLIDSITWQKKIDPCLRKNVYEKRDKLFQLIAHLQSIDPNHLLKKGFCILFKEKDNTLIPSVQELPIHDTVRLLFHDGKALLTVNAIEPKKRTTHQEKYLF